MLWFHMSPELIFRIPLNNAGVNFYIPVLKFYRYYPSIFGLLIIHHHPGTLLHLKPSSQLRWSHAVCNEADLPQRIAPDKLYVLLTSGTVKPWVDHHPFLPFPVFAASSFPHCWQQESPLFPGTILFLLQYILTESLLSPVISAIREKLLPFFLSRSILFLSSFVTVMYSLESYEGPALHLFKEFRDGEFRGMKRKVKENVAGVIRSHSWIKE